MPRVKSWAGGGACPQGYPVPAFRFNQRARSSSSFTSSPSSFIFKQQNSCIFHFTTNSSQRKLNFCQKLREIVANCFTFWQLIRSSSLVQKITRTSTWLLRPGGNRFSKTLAGTKLYTRLVNCIGRPKHSGVSLCSRENQLPRQTVSNPDKSCPKRDDKRVVKVRPATRIRYRVCGGRFTSQKSPRSTCSCLSRATVNF